MQTRPRTLVTQDRIDEFVSKLSKLGKKRDAIRALCMGERNFLKNAKYIKRGDETKTPVTLSIARRHNLLVRYRAAITERFGEDHPALEYMRLTGTTTIEQDGKQVEVPEHEARNAVTREDVIARHVDRRPIDADAHIDRAFVILEATKAGLPRPVLSIAAALIAVTGRRPIEILLTGEFKRVKKADRTLFDSSIPAAKRWTLLFDGQAKTRGAESARNEPYEIPVLADPELVLHVFKQLRERYDLSGLTSKQVSDRTSKELGGYAKRSFLDAAKTAQPLNPKALRAAYATIAYEWYAPDAQSWNSYTARLLGHSAQDLVTSFSYDQFWPVGSKREYERHIHAAARETLKLLRDRRSNEDDPVQARFLDEKIAAVERRLEANA